MRLKLAILILSYSGWVRPTEAGPISTDSKSSAFYYLLNYGYIKKSDNQDTAQILSEEAVTKAIKDFQVNFRHFFRLFHDLKRFQFVKNFASKCFALDSFDIFCQFFFI